MAKNDSLQKAAGSPVKIELRGQSYTVHPLTLGDLADFEGYLRSEKIADFMRVAKDLSSEERVQVLAKLSSEPLGRDESAQAMSTMKGVRFLLWKSLGQAHPNLELEGMDKIVDLTNFEQVTTVIEGIGGLDEEENPTETSTGDQESD